MTITTSTSKIFSKRKLVILQKIYRSREFISQINSINTKKKSNEEQYIFYGTIGTLAPIQRTISREYFSEFKDIKVKFRLFSASIVKFNIGFSYFQEFNSLIKGTSYQIKLNIKKPVQKNTPCFDNQYQSYIEQSSVPLFINNLKKIRFGEENTFDFVPTVIFYKSSLGPQVPRRIDKFNHYTKSINKQKIFILLYLIDKFYKG
jgi:hypothetical protein